MNAERSPAEAERIGNLMIFQWCIGGCRYVPQAVSSPVTLWRDVWDECSPALLAEWCRIIGKPTWHKFRWAEMVPEMHDYICEKSIRAGDRARVIFKQHPEYQLRIDEVLQ